MFKISTLATMADRAVARGEYTVTLCERCAEKALDKYTGEYHQRLLLGHSRLSGADLQGKARKYSSWYQRKASELVYEMTTRRLGFETRHKGRRLLVIGGLDDCCRG